MGAIFILLAVGALIGTWNLAGTIPTIVSYGLALLRPAIFFAIIAVICALVGAVTGSSWWPAIGGSKRASGRRCERRRCSHFCCHPSRDRRRPPPRLPPRARRGSSRRGAGQRLCVAQELSNRCSGGYRGRPLITVCRGADLRQTSPRSSSPPRARAVGLGPHTTKSAAPVTGQYHQERTDSHVSTGSPSTTKSRRKAARGPAVPRRVACSRPRP